MLSTTLLPTLFLALASATPALAGSNCTQNTNANPAASEIITPTLLEAIMPLSGSCANRGDQCTNSTTAAPYFAAAFDRYGLTTKQERAAVMAICAFESVQMQYKNNSVPANVLAGQGTVNQQHGQFNVEYANSFPELQALNLSTSNVLSEVTKDQYNFGTGAWYYKLQSTQECSNARTAALVPTTTAWDWFSQSYMPECVGVNVTADRTVYWNTAMSAFGITNDTCMGV